MNPPLMSTIRARAASLGLSQADLARALAVDYRMVSRWWTGKRDPNIASLERLLEVLNLELRGKGE